MTVAYVLAHFDDEYAALPLILEAKTAGEAQHFLYLADYRSPELSAGRLAETRDFLARFGLPPELASHIGLGSGAYDGVVHTHLPALLPLLRKALDRIGPVDRIVIAAWEGGHQDHDAVAALVLALRPGAKIEQFALYNRRRIGPLPFQAGAPIPENGPVRPVKMKLGDWLAWATAVAAYPSQAKTWLGLWPSMFTSYMLRRGYGVQTLDPARLSERPHDGDLLYERRFGVSYEDVARAVAEIRAAPEPG